MNPREEIAHLTEVLERANHQYYVLDAPEMEDYEYDRLLRRLEELEAAPSTASSRRSTACPSHWSMWTARSSAAQRAATAASART